MLNEMMLFGSVFLDSTLANSLLSQSPLSLHPPSTTTAAMTTRTLPTIIATRSVFGIIPSTTRRNVAWNADGQCLILTRQGVTVAVRHGPFSSLLHPAILTPITDPLPGYSIAAPRSSARCIHARRRSRCEWRQGGGHRRRHGHGCRRTELEYSQAWAPSYWRDQVVDYAHWHGQGQEPRGRI